jgi:hypothetical protein
MFSLKSLIIRIVKYYEWETVFFAQDLEQYARTKGKLLNNNIVVKTKIINNSGGFSRSGRSGNIKNSYEIMVKPEFVYRANEIIHNER